MSCQEDMLAGLAEIQRDVLEAYHVVKAEGFNKNAKDFIGFLKKYDGFKLDIQIVTNLNSLNNISNKTGK